MTSTRPPLSIRSPLADAARRSVRFVASVAVPAPLEADESAYEAWDEVGGREVPFTV